MIDIIGLTLAARESFREDWSKNYEPIYNPKKGFEMDALQPVPVKNDFPLPTQEEIDAADPVYTQERELSISAGMNEMKNDKDLQELAMQAFQEGQDARSLIDSGETSYDAVHRAFVDKYKGEF